MINKKIGELFRHIGDMFINGECDDITDEERLFIMASMVKLSHKGYSPEEERKIRHATEFCELLARDNDQLHREIDELKGLRKGDGSDKIIRYIFPKITKK